MSHRKKRADHRAQEVEQAKTLAAEQKLKKEQQELLKRMGMRSVVTSQALLFEKPQPAPSIKLNLGDKLIAALGKK